MSRSASVTSQASSLSASRTVTAAFESLANCSVPAGRRMSPNDSDSESDRADGLKLPWLPGRPGVTRDRPAGPGPRRRRRCRGCVRVVWKLFKFHWRPGPLPAVPTARANAGPPLRRRQHHDSGRPRPGRLADAGLVTVTGAVAPLSTLGPGWRIDPASGPGQPRPGSGCSRARPGGPAEWPSCTPALIGSDSPAIGRRWVWQGQLSCGAPPTFPAVPAGPDEGCTCTKHNLPR